MKINILCVMFLFAAGFSFAQKENITDAAMLMKKYNPMVGAEKAKETATKAKEFIDLAGNIEKDTKDWFKMHLYRGMIYFALIEVAQREAMTGKAPDQVLLEEYKAISIESFSKILNDPKGKKYVQDVNEFLQFRIDQANSIGLLAFKNGKFDLALMAFLVEYEINSFKQYVDSSSIQNSSLCLSRYADSLILNQPDSLINDSSFTKLDSLINITTDLIPLDFNLQAIIINVALKEGVFSKTEKALLDGIKLRPDNANLHQILGDIYLSEGDLENCESYYKKAIQINNSSLSNYLLGSFYVNLAGDKFQEANDIYPDPREKILINEGEELMFKAIPYLEIAAQEMSENFELALIIARCYKKKEGDSENYKKWYQKYKNLKN